MEADRQDDFDKSIEEHGPDSVAYYGSGQLYTQESYTANKLFKAGHRHQQRGWESSALHGLSGHRLYHPRLAKMSHPGAMKTLIMRIPSLSRGPIHLNVIPFFGSESWTASGVIQIGKLIVVDPRANLHSHACRFAPSHLFPELMSPSTTR